MCILASFLFYGAVFGRSIYALWFVTASSPHPVVSSTAFTGATPLAMAINPEQLPWLVIATLAFALLALAILFLYTYKIQSKSYDVLEGLGRLGRAVRVTSPAPFARPGAEKESLRSAGLVLKIEGPGVVTVGVESAEFTATIEDGTAPHEAQWSVAPVTAATVNPKTGPRVKVTAATVGAFTLSAEVPATQNADTSAKLSTEVIASLTREVVARLAPEAIAPVARGEVQVAAVLPEINAIELPFVGRGYGSMAMAIVLVAAVIILGLAGTLSGEGVATLLGGLLGYIFGVAVVPQSASSASKKPGGERT
jgi:hypothetical protein